MPVLKEKTNNVFLSDTKIENIFINEYIAMSPGDYVKVFLVISMSAELDLNYSIEEIAKILNVAEEDVKKAFIYWASLGVLKKEGDDYIIVSLKEKAFGENAGEKKTKSRVKKDTNSMALLENENIKNMYKTIDGIIGKPLTGIEVTEINEWIENFFATPEIITYAYAYGKKKQKDNIRYIGAIVKEWASKGYKTVNQVDEHLERTDQRFHVYRRIMKELGFFRNATEEEKRMIDRWIEEDGFTLDDILFACKKTTGISNPNLNYIDKVLVGWAKDKEKGKSSANDKKQITWRKIEKLYEEDRERTEKEARQRKEAVHLKYPEIAEIDEYIRIIGMDMAKEMVSGGSDKLQRIEKLKIELLNKKEMRKKILAKNNIPVDYDTIKYVCNECKDTGIRESGDKCTCYSKKIDEVQNA